MSLSIGDCIERERDRQTDRVRGSKRERGYVHL